MRELAKDYSPNGLFYLRHYINADDFLRDLQSGTGINLGRFNLSVTREQLRAALQTFGRIRSDHPFLDAMSVVDSIVTAPAESCDSYITATIADYVRAELLLAGSSFTFETVMSHPSKVEFFRRARDHGFKTYLYFVALESSDANRDRVHNRAELGGHDVPEDKIRDRYERSMQLLTSALEASYRAFLFDNSIQPVWLAELTPKGTLELRVGRESLPKWFTIHVSPSFGY